MRLTILNHFSMVLPCQHSIQIGQTKRVRALFIEKEKG